MVRMPTFLFAPLESVLNRNIAESRAARAVCARLAGKVLALHLTGAPVEIYLRSTGTGLAFAVQHEGVAHATLTGTIVGLARLAGAAPDAAVRGGAVRIAGDAEVAQSFSELLKLAHPDFEEELSRLIGDVAAHRVGNLVRGALSFGERLRATIGQNVAEYLQEESRDLPTRTEADEFLAAVDQLREDVDRAQARLNALERTAGPATAPSTTRS
jgi:ubiquinone biosynthesis protein UbiJ